MRQTDIPNEHHFARHLSAGQIVPSDDGIQVVTPDAFRKRANEDGVSGAWLEYYTGTTECCAAAVVREWKAAGRTVRPSHKLALAMAGKIKEVGIRHGRPLRVRHEPDGPASSYAQVRGILDTEAQLLEALAREAVISLIPCA